MMRKNRLKHALQGGQTVFGTEEALAMVNACRYPPQGKRGVSGASRAAGYGYERFLDHVHQSNDEILTIALIEDQSGVESIEEIVDVPGLDIVCPGAGDLSASLGLVGQPQHPTVQAGVKRVVQAVNAQPKQVLGCHVMDPSQVDSCLAQGAQFIIYSQDSRVIFSAYKTALEALRQQD